METKLCQSCGMPMNAPDAHYGTEKDGSLSPDYCSWCYHEGAFTGGDCTMEKMIENCLPFELKARSGMTEEQVRASMHKLFPTLKRWSK